MTDSVFTVVVVDPCNTNSRRSIEKRGSFQTFKDAVAFAIVDMASNEDDAYTDNLDAACKCRATKNIVDMIHEFLSRDISSQQLFSKLKQCNETHLNRVYEVMSATEEFYYEIQKEP